MKYSRAAFIALALCLVCFGPAHGQQQQPAPAKAGAQSSAATVKTPVADKHLQPPSSKARTTATPNEAPPPRLFSAYRVLPPDHPGDKYLRYDRKIVAISVPAPDLSAEASTKAEGATHKKAAIRKKAAPARPSLPAKAKGAPP